MSKIQSYSMLTGSDCVQDVDKLELDEELKCLKAKAAMSTWVILGNSFVQENTTVCLSRSCTEILIDIFHGVPNSAD